MSSYPLSKRMRRIISVLDRLTGKPIEQMSTAEIEKLSGMYIPNNALTRKLLDKPAKQIQRTALRIPTRKDRHIPAYLYWKRVETPFNKPESYKKKPIIIYYHGGGWILGYTVIHDFYCRNLAEYTGAIVLAVDYRLAPSNRFPAAFDDSYDALVWASRHCEAWAADPKALFVLGDSAGGNLAAAAALAARDRNGPNIAGQVLIYPVTDATMSCDSYKRYADAPRLDAKRMKFFIENYFENPEDVENPYFSPLLAESLQDLPPALVITAEFDPLADEGEAYHRRLSQEGVNSEFLFCKRTVHGFIDFPKADGTDETRKAVTRFLSEHT
jgi:acetyl esterase